MKRLIAFLALWKAGKSVADPRKWQRRQITATMLIPVLLAAVDLSRAYGYDIPLDHDSITTLAGVLIVLVNVCGTIITSVHIGIGRADGEGVDEGPVAASTARSAQTVPEAEGNGGDPAVRHQDGGEDVSGVFRRSEPPDKAG